MELYILTNQIADYERLKFLQPIEGIILPSSAAGEKLVKECRAAVGDRLVVVELEGSDYAELLDSAKKVEQWDKLATIKLPSGFHGVKVVEYYNSQKAIKKNTVVGPISSLKEALEAGRNKANVLEINHSMLANNPGLLTEIHESLSKEKLSSKIMVSGIKSLEEAKKYLNENIGIVLSPQLIQQAIDEDIYFS